MGEPSCPPSATIPWINFSGLFLFLGLFVTPLWPAAWPLEQQAWLAMALAAVPIVILNTWRQGLPAPQLFDAKRWLKKTLALWLAFAFIAAFYWLMPEYYDALYRPYFFVLRRFVPFLPLLSLLYMAVAQRYNSVTDAYDDIGDALLLRWHGRWGLLGQHALGWLVKAFFLPLMYVYLLQAIEQIHAMHTVNYQYGMNLLYLIDVLFALVGYLLTLKLFDTHIRSTDGTWFGWIVCVMCYQPFWQMFHSHYAQYVDQDWLGWLGGHELAQLVWTGLILFATLIYAWSTVAFGVRFSNLTYRGLIAHGPYRITKHPAYLFKNLSWWLASAPFLMSGPWQDTLHNCLLLLLVNGIYILRAYTEERHLSRYPEYRVYSDFMEQRGPLRFLPRLYRA